METRLARWIESGGISIAVNIIAAPALGYMAPCDELRTALSAVRAGLPRRRKGSGCCFMRSYRIFIRLKSLLKDFPPKAQNFKLTQRICHHDFACRDPYQAGVGTRNDRFSMGMIKRRESFADINKDEKTFLRHLRFSLAIPIAF